MGRSLAKYTFICRLPAFGEASATPPAIAVHRARRRLVTGTLLLAPAHPRGNLPCIAFWSHDNLEQKAASAPSGVASSPFARGGGGAVRGGKRQLPNLTVTSTFGSLFGLLLGG